MVPRERTWRGNSAMGALDEIVDGLVGLGQVGAGVGMSRWQVGQALVHVARRVCSSRTTW